MPLTKNYLPTRWNSQRLIDYCITNALEDIEPCQARFERISDHQVMETKLSITLQHSKQMRTQKTPPLDKPKWVDNDQWGDLFQHCYFEGIRFNGRRSATSKRTTLNGRKNVKTARLTVINFLWITGGTLSC